MTICEIKARQGSPHKLHITRDGFETLCGRNVEQRTMIPLRCWGNVDREWCEKCAEKSEPKERRKGKA